MSLLLLFWSLIGLFILDLATASGSNGELVLNIRLLPYQASKPDVPVNSGISGRLVYNKKAQSPRLTTF